MIRFPYLYVPRAHGFLLTRERGWAMFPCFHLSIGVPSVEDSAEFFTSLLGATVTHRDASGYVNLDFFGTQITLTPADAVTHLAGFHFGVNLEMEEFGKLAERLFGNVNVVAAPHVIDANTPMERKKLYIRCPAGYLIELKGYRKQGL